MLNIVPIPLREPLFAEPAGRPGDWWEPVSISVGEIGTQLVAEARRCRLPLDLCVALVLEHALVMDDICESGIELARARVVLSAAGDAVPAVGPGRVHASYVRMLRGGERNWKDESVAQLARRDLVLPLRLHDTLVGLDVSQRCDAASLDEALGWEIAAATAAQFMREWALRTLLFEAVSQQLG